ncbi:Sulfur carrier ThiS/MoaD-like [Bartonella apihabitans]|uniref:sulfur carrier protein ThiS n=1 Tax=Bartonella TaxID=773 RepID=UPI0018DBF696|nr:MULTISPECIES: sulfur carrier protein ThiS [Bartonella]MBH9994768.1 sulfur carrier protein ThiS [Bartonella sp. P0291]MBH9996887.1 sulfur carrier protein ThiS [Bartonella sp. M0192]MBH9999047.1 sulfur carrier protein ThiS [Bartonella sp. M0191]MBI0007427.1 sulfur carrier protein ThiS [Bartonella sp. M0193]MBI0010338.1 sulfur carrier protein ThiS [Bartonella sp. M0176]
MQLFVNGEEKNVGAETLSALLNELDYEGDWLATAVNAELVSESEREDFKLNNGDRIEILSPMQGG